MDLRHLELWSVCIDWLSITLGLFYLEVNFKIALFLPFVVNSAYQKKVSGISLFGGRGGVCNVCVYVMYVCMYSYI